MDDLDSILSGKGTSVPAPAEETVTPEVETQSEPIADHVEELGEAAPKQMVPTAALHAERQKSKRYTDQVAEFQKQLTDSQKRMEEQNAQWERRMQELAQSLRPKEPPAPPPPEVDFWDDPKAAAAQAVSPQLQQMQAVMLQQAEQIARIKLGDDKVNAAEEAFLKAHQSGQLDPLDFQRVVNAPNRWAAAVEWHDNKPENREAQLRTQLQAEIRAQVIAEIKAKGHLPMDDPLVEPADPDLMPTNFADARNAGKRSGPAWSGPPSIQEILK